MVGLTVLRKSGKIGKADGIDIAEVCCRGLYEVPRLSGWGDM